MIGDGTMKNVILNLATKSLYSLILTSILFTLILPEAKIFLVILDAVWLLLLISYGKRQNRELLRNAISLTLGVLLSYSVIKYIRSGWPKNPDGFTIICLVVAVLEIATSIALIVSGHIEAEQEKTEQKEKNSLFPAHQYDLDRIREYVKSVSIVGVNASWGNGKTFVVEHLCQELQGENNYVVIWIDLLTCNLDEIEVILTSELEKILTAHRIYSKNSRQLKAMLNDSFLNQVQDFVMDSNAAMSSAFSELKCDLEKIDTDILIVYDDLDRISEKKSIQKIFAISEKLAGGRIHILYQYDNNNLTTLGLNREYLEKYIPFTVNLTNMEFDDNVKELWNELEMDQAGIEQKEILNIPTILPANPEVEKMLTPHIKMTCQVHGVSIRTVRIYLEEAKMMLNQNKYFSRGEVRGTVLRFLFLKNFWKEYYEEFRVWQDVQETLLFEYNERKYTMSDILSKVSCGEFSEVDVNKLFQIQHNQEVYFLLRMLDCEFIWKKEEKPNNRQHTDLESLPELQKMEKKNRTNHIIWNVLANGKSEFTDMRAAIDKFKKEVLSLGEDEWEEAWNKYCDDMFHDLLEKGNHTIFTIGDGYFIPLFQGFRIVGANSDDWKRLLEFYGKMHKDMILSLDLVKCLYYCDVYQIGVYLKAIQLFCSCKIAGNLNGEEAYWKFLQVYLSQIFYFGYSQNVIFEPWNFEWNNLTEEEKKLFVDRIPEMKKTLVDEKKNWSSMSPIEEECDQIGEFLQKNLELIKTEGKLENKPKIRVEERRVVWPHQENYDRLLQLKHNDMTEEEKTEFIFEVNESYIAEELFPIEVSSLMDGIEK